jgi:hypothetical protein
MGQDFVGLGVLLVIAWMVAIALIICVAAK